MPTVIVDEAPVTLSSPMQWMQRAIIAAIVACALATPAMAQRVAPVAFAPVHQARSYTPTQSAVRSEPSYAVAAGAVAGAILGGSYGYALAAADCDGQGTSQHSCRRTALIGGTVAGAAIGAIIGHIIQLGEEYDAKRAARRAAADSASTLAPVHP